MTRFPKTLIQTTILKKCHIICTYEITISYKLTLNSEKCCLFGSREIMSSPVYICGRATQSEHSCKRCMQWDKPRSRPPQLWSVRCWLSAILPSSSQADQPCKNHNCSTTGFGHCSRSCNPCWLLHWTGWPMSWGLSTGNHISSEACNNPTVI